MPSVQAPPSAEPDPAPPQAAERAPAWALPGGLVLVVSLLVAGFAALSSVVILVLGRTNETDWALYLLTLVVLVPAALAAGRRLAGTAAAGGGPQAVSALAAWGAVGLLAIGLLARVTYSLGGLSSVVLLPLVAAWTAALASIERSARRGRRTGAELLRGDAHRPWTLAALLAAASVLAFLSPELFRPVQLGASVAIAAALTLVHLRLRSLGRARRTWLLVDATAVALVILTVTDVSGYLEYLRPDARTYVTGDGLVFGPQLLAFSQRIHENFWLGPTNDMLHGRAMLVDTWSQYGVGSFYFLGAFFQLAPLGYGALGLLAGFLTALQYALAYGVVRLAGCARTLAVPAIAAAVLGLVLGSIGSPNDYPGTGGLRFGIPWLIVALAVLSARYPPKRRLLLTTATALVGVAAVWSFETFAYAGATFVAVAGFEAATLETDRRRVHAFARSLLEAAGCCLGAHLLLAVATRALAGSWPDWSPYVAFLDAYSGENLYSFAVAPWSPGLVVALVYLASAIAVAGLVARRHPLVVERRPALMALAASSGFGLASVTYFVGHSHPNDLSVVSLPAIAAGCVWVALLSGRLGNAPRAHAIGTVAVAAGFWVVALVAVSGWPETTAKWRRTALVNVIPDGGRGGSLRHKVGSLWHSPPGDPRAVEAQALLDRHLAPGAPALVIVEPELSVETLVRAGRVNLLPISHPAQDNLVPKHAEPRVLEAVDRLPSGTLMLAQPATFGPATKLPAAYGSGKLVRLQIRALNRIRARFRLQVVERGTTGLMIVRLLPRR